MKNEDIIFKKVKEALIRAASTYKAEQKSAFKKAIKNEKNSNAKWTLEKLLENSNAGGNNKSPLCDDTGIPHLFLEVGKNQCISSDLIETINKGVTEGLKELPGRPMAIIGNDIERIEQSRGLSLDPGDILPAPLIVKSIKEEVIRLHILMQGGGPEIRGKTYRVFHKREISTVIDEIVNWSIEGASKLGCTPCTPAIGIGRSHFEATSLMLEAMIKGRFDIQNDIEKEITRRINGSNIGPLGLGGNTTALATFLRIGEQRASGVRIVCLRLCCCVEPRVASVIL